LKQLAGSGSADVFQGCVHPLATCQLLARRGRLRRTLGFRFGGNDRNLVRSRGDLCVFPVREGESDFSHALAGFAGDPHGVVERCPSAALRQCYLEFDGWHPRLTVGKLNVGDRMNVLGDTVVVLEKHPFAAGILGADHRFQLCWVVAANQGPTSQFKPEWPTKLARWCLRPLTSDKGVLAVSALHVQTDVLEAIPTRVNPGRRGIDREIGVFRSI
jgi:hypothetical protein